MATGQGAASKAAGKIESGNYGSPIACDGAAETNQLHFISEGLTLDNKFESSIHLDGTSGKKSLYETLKKVIGDLQIEMHYDGLTSLLCCALGDSNQDVSPINKGSGAYAHYIDPSPDLSTRAFNYYEKKALTGNAIRRMTICFEKSVSIHENMSCMVDGFSLDIKPDRSTMSFSLIAYNQALDSATNNTSINWAVPTANQLSWENAEIFLKARDKFTISATNKVIVIKESADVTITLTEGTYTGGELAQEMASKINVSSLLGDYRIEYREETRRFVFRTIDSVSFIIRAASATMTAEDLLGFYSDNAANIRVESQNNARTNAYVAFSSSDNVGISSLALSFSNGLSSDDQDTLSSGLIVEPERNELRNVSGSIEIPRYKNDIFLDAANYSTTYEMLIKFTGSVIGGANSEEFNLFIPSIRFGSAKAPISGGNIIKQTIDFQAAFPDFLDFVNFFQPEYFLQQDFFNSVAATVQSLGIHSDGLYFASVANLKKFTKETGISTVGTGTGSIKSIKQYGNDLYLGEINGIIQKWDGSTLSLSCDVGTGDVSALEQYGSDFYALEKTTGKVLKYDGSTWSLSCDTLLISAVDLISFDGSLWVYGSDGTNIDIYKYDGTTWSLSGSNVTPDIAGTAGFSIHEGALYFASKDKIFFLKNGTWVQIADIGTTDSLAIVSFMGELIVFDNTPSAFVINLSEGTATTIATSLTGTAVGKPILYDGKLFAGNSLNSVTLLKNIQEIYFKLQNQNSINPL